MDAAMNLSVATSSNDTEDRDLMSDIVGKFSMTTTSVALLWNIAFLIWTHRQNVIPGTIPRMLITNLCVSDSICCGFNVLLYAINDNIEVPMNWLGMVICRLTHAWYIYWVACQTSVNNMMIINIERYLSVVHPSAYRRLTTVGFARLSIFLSWLLGAVLMSFSLFRADRAENECVQTTLPLAVNKFRSVTRLLTFFVIPLIVTLYCNLAVVLRLRWYSRMVSLGRRNEENQRMIVCFTFSIGLAFVCFFGPDALFHFIDINFVKVETNRDLYFHALGLLLDCHAILSPILYFVTFNRCCRQRGETAAAHCLKKSGKSDVTQSSVVSKHDMTDLKPSVY